MTHQSGNWGPEGGGLQELRIPSPCLRTAGESRGPHLGPDCLASHATLDKSLSSLDLSFPTGTNADSESLSLGPSGSCIIDTGGSGWDPRDQGGTLVAGGGEDRSPALPSAPAGDFL